MIDFISRLLSDLIYWILHTEIINLIAACIIILAISMLVVNPKGGLIGMAKPHRRPRSGKFYGTKRYREKLKNNSRVGKSLGRKWHRNRLFQQDNICGLCEEPIINAKDATVDHIVPLSKGGRDSIENMQLAHSWCNREKADTLPDDIIRPESEFLNEAAG